MMIPKWSVLPLFAFAMAAGIIAIAMTSGCITNQAAVVTNKFVCESVDGGTWLDQFNECCPKGCPTAAIYNPATPTQEAIIERCSICWL